MDYSNFPPLFYHHPINTAPSPLYPTYVPPFYSTNNPLITPSPNFCFKHGYSPPSSTSFLSSNPYTSFVSPQTTLPAFHTPTIHTPLSFSSNQQPHNTIQPTTTPYINQHTTHFLAAPTTPFPPPNTNTTSNLPIRRITTSQRDERKAQRLCFYCDEKFVPGQRCKTPRFLMLIVDEEKQEVQKVEEEPEKQRAEEVEPLKQASQQLSTSPVNTPSREFESGKNGYDYFPAPPPKLPSSLLQEPSFTFSVPQPPPPLPDLKSSPITSFSQTMTLPPPLKPSEKALTPLLSSLRQPTEPPDLHWPSEIFPPPPPSPLRPPAKPPDQHSQAEYFLTLALPPPPKPPDRNFLRSTAKSSVKIISWYFRTVRSILHHDYQNNFAPSDQFSAFRAESRPLKENTIRVILYCPIMRRHVALLVSYHSKQLCCQLSSIQHIPPTSNRHVSQFDLLTTFLLLRHVTCDSTRHQV